MFLGYVRQSTAVTVRTPQFVGTDGNTEQTALTSQSGRITKNGTGGAFTPSSWSHDANGYYLVGLSTSDTDTIGRLTIQISNSSTYLSVPIEFHVLHANVYDALFGSTALSTYAGADTSGTTTLLSRLTSGRAANLDNTAIVAKGTVATGTSTTSFTATIAGSNLLSVNGAYNSRKILFQSGGLLTEPRTITSYTVSGGTATFDLTNDPLTSTPSNGDTFIIG